MSSGLLHGWRSSLSLRLALLYATGTTVLLLVLGAGLAWQLRTQLEARDREEIDLKTDHAQRILRELCCTEAVDAVLERIEEVTLDHPHLSIGVRRGALWLVPLRPELRALVGADGNDLIPHAPQLGLFEVGRDLWWLRRIDFVGQGDVVYSAYVGLHVSPTQLQVRALLSTMAVAGLAGVLASALLGGWVARRGLAPVALIARAAERVTADRLGEPLPAHDAPAEVRGLVHSVNRMLMRLRESFASLEQFSADLAHELRTPINNLMLQTQVTLSRPRGAEEYREALHSNLGELERLQRMVADMLFLARADKGMFELKPEPLDLVEEARGVAEFFEPAAAERQQHIDIEGAAGVAGDRPMVRRAITNLLSNAVRYAPPGATIRVRASRTPVAATLAIENPAEARSPEQLRRLFNRFERGAAAEGCSDGAGLGLSIVESIMRLHGGTVGADSGAFGIRFSLVFPPRRSGG